MDIDTLKSYFIIYLFYFQWFFSLINCYNTNYLTKSQWANVRNILYFIKTQKTSNNDYEQMKNKIQNILYYKYEKLAYWKAYHFKKFHYHKCSHISLIELSLYSRIGLCKAIKNYNPEYDFNKYVNLYIHSELLRGLTELYPICSISKVERMIKKDYFIGDNKTSNEIKFERQHYKIRLNTQFVGNDNWLIDTNINQDVPILSKIIDKEKYLEIWDKIHLLPPIQKTIFQLKYDFYFEKKQSNLKISKILGCSEEYIRVQHKIGNNELIKNKNK